MVGAVRFELTTSCTRNKRASQATLRPDPGKEKVPVDGALGKKFIARQQRNLLESFLLRAHAFPQTGIEDEDDDEDEQQLIEEQASRVGLMERLTNCTKV